MASDENTNTQLHSDTRKRKRSDGDGDGEGEGEGPTAPSLRGDGANWREAFPIGGGKEEGARTQAVALLVRWFDEEERTAGAVRLLDLIGSLQGDLNAQWLFPGIQRVYRRLYPDSPVRRKWAGLAAALILWRLHQKPHLPNKPQQVIGYLTLAKLTDALDSIAASSTLAEDTFLGRATEDTMR